VFSQFHLARESFNSLADGEIGLRATRTTTVYSKANIICFLSATPSFFNIQELSETLTLAASKNENAVSLSVGGLVPDSQIVVTLRAALKPT